MASTEQMAVDRENAYRAQVQETQRLYAEAVKLKESFEASGAGLESDDYQKVEAAYDAWEKAGDAEMELKAEADKLSRLSGLTARRAQSMGLQGSSDPKEARKAVAQTIGASFVESSEFSSWYKAVAPQGHMPSTQVQNSPAVNVPNMIDFVRSPRAALLTGTSSTSAGAFVRNEDSGLFVDLGRRPLTLLDIISRRTTGSDAVDFVRQTSRTNNAAPVAEATDVSGGSGVKPQSDLALELVTTNVRTIAHWIAASRRALSDVGQLRGIIDDELRDGLNEELEDQIISGSGVGQNFEGLDAVTGTQDQAWDTDILKTTREARTLVRTVGRDIPNAYAFNPADWETIDLTQDNEARYFFGGPMVMGTPRLWGLPVVESEALTAGWGWVGNWSRAVLWDREQANILVSDSHSDFFIRNLIAILAELRAAFAVTKPVAFVEIDLTS